MHETYGVRYSSHWRDNLSRPAPRLHLIGVVAAQMPDIGLAMLGQQAAVHRVVASVGQWRRRRCTT